MEDKVEFALSLVSEDGDSFAKRAEMYYKNRPELINFIEEAFRCFRAMAERYDSLSTDLQKANTTIATCLPEQIQFAMDDDDDFLASKHPKFSSGPAADPSKVPKAPARPMKGMMHAATKKLEPKKSSIPPRRIKPKSGLSKAEAVEEIDKLQKDILSLQTMKEYVKSSYESGISKFFALENDIMEKQDKVSRLQDEFGVSTMIDDNDARTLMAEAAIKSCKETLADLQNKQENSAEKAEVENKKIEDVCQRLESIKYELLPDQTDNVQRVDQNSNHGAEEFQSLKQEMIGPERKKLEALREKIKEHKEGSGGPLTVSELADKIDDLVNLVISLESAVLSQNVLIERLRTEADDLQSQIRRLEENKGGLMETHELQSRVKELEEKLYLVQNIYMNITTQNNDIKDQFAEAHSSLNDLSEKLPSVEPDEELEETDLLEEEEHGLIEKRPEKALIEQDKGKSGDEALLEHDKGKGGGKALLEQGKGEGGGTALIKQDKEEGGGQALIEQDKGKDGGEALIEQDKKEGGGQALIEQDKGEGGGKALIEQDKGEGGGQALLERDKGEGGGEALIEQNKGKGGVEVLVELDKGEPDAKLLVEQDKGESGGETLVEQDIEKGGGEALIEQDKGKGGGEALIEQNKGEGGGEALIEQDNREGGGEALIEQDNGEGGGEALIEQNKGKGGIEVLVELDKGEHDGKALVEQDKGESGGETSVKLDKGKGGEALIEQDKGEGGGGDNKLKSNPPRDEEKSDKIDENLNASSRNSNNLSGGKEVATLQNEKDNGNTVLNSDNSGTEKREHIPKTSISVLLDVNLNAEGTEVDVKSQAIRGDVSVLIEKFEDELNWQQMLLHGVEDKERILLAEYVAILRNYKEVKKKLSDEEKKNETLFETMLQLRNTKSALLKKDQEIQFLRHKLNLLKQDSCDIPGAKDSTEDESFGMHPTEEDKEEIKLLINQPKTLSPIEEKLRGQIDAVLEENLEFWLRFSNSFHQVEKFKTEVHDLQDEIVQAKKKNELRQDGKSQGSISADLKAEIRAIYKHLSEKKTEVGVWLEQSELLKEEVQHRITSICEIQEAITNGLKEGVESDEITFSSHQAAKFHGEILNMKQENNKVNEELLAGIDHITALKIEIEKTLVKINAEFKLTERKPSSSTSSSRSYSISKIPLRSFLFGIKARKHKHSIFSYRHYSRSTK
ncbi:kinase-interacting protein 1-like [Daucus carota subsp. sativus]|uniref:kinase-interacting protein 1-like n=1 Tax=Daucus carota subsp. sativus TaxID=79200 RepID=UPI003082FC2B